MLAGYVVKGEELPYVTDLAHETATNIRTVDRPSGEPIGEQDTGRAPDSDDTAPVMPPD